jgi:hypothetical protein
LDASFLNGTDIHLLSNGSLNFADAFFSNAAPYYVQTLYDQTGHGTHLDGLTHRPTFVSTGNGLTVPNIVFVRASSQYLELGSATFSINLPATFNSVFKRTFTTGQYDGFLNAGTLTTNANNVANQVYMYNGGAAGQTELTATDGAWHNMQSVFIGSTSDTLQVDNKTPISGTNCGTANVSSVDLFMGSNPTSDHLDGFMAEAGIWPAPAFTGTQLTQMYNNQHTYFGVF